MENKQKNATDVIYDCLGGAKNPVAADMVAKICWELAQNDWMFAVESGVRETIDEASTLEANFLRAFNDEIVHRNSKLLTALKEAVELLDEKGWEDVTPLWHDVIDAEQITYE